MGYCTAVCRGTSCYSSLLPAERVRHNHSSVSWCGGAIGVRCVHWDHNLQEQKTKRKEDFITGFHIYVYICLKCTLTRRSCLSRTGKLTVIRGRKKVSGQSSPVAEHTNTQTLRDTVRRRASDKRQGVN